MAAHTAVMRDVAAKARAGVPVLGICNGFQVLCEAGLLPGVLMRNASLRFVCRDVWLKIERPDTPFTSAYRKGEVIRLPVAHGDGNYFADAATLDALEAEGRMTDAGRAAFAARRENRSGIYSFEQRSVELPPAYAKLLKAHRAAWRDFQSRAPSYRKAVTWWIVSAKQEATRQRRLARLIELAAQGQPIPAFSRP